MFFPPRVKRKNRLSTPVRAAGVFPARSLGKKPFPLSLLRVLKSRCRYLFYRGRCLGYFSSFRSKRGRVDKRREEKMGATTLVELEDPPPFSSFLPFRSLFPCSADRQRSTLASGGVNAVTVRRVVVHARGARDVDALPAVPARVLALFSRKEEGKKTNFLLLLLLVLLLSFSFSKKVEMISWGKTHHSDALVAVPEGAISTAARAVAISSVVVEVTAAAAAAGPVAGDRDGADDDVGHVESGAPHAAVGVSPAAAPEVGRAIELPLIEIVPSFVLL